MPDPRRGLAALLALGVAVALSACVGIPSSGSVSQGVAINADSGGANVQYNPEGPANGASKQDILKGFVAAFTSATGGYAVAKQYLSSDFQSKWDPRASVQVRSGQARLSQVNDTTMDYSFTASATVNASGSYKDGTQPFTLEFSFVKQGSEWRINSAPAGIVLSDQTFQRIFSPSPLYFLSADDQNLVPDLRWFPNGTAVTRIVSALLAGPPTWLKGAAFSRFPDGTQLSDSSGSVIVDSGIARVDLSREALGANTKDRQLMQLQLSESLRSVGSISRVSLSVVGTPLQIDDLGSNAPQADTKVDPQALVFRKGEFGFYANGKVAALSPLSGRIVALDPQAATLSSDQSTAAVLASGGVSIVRKSQAATAPVDTRPGLIAPSMDENGYVWSVPAGSPNAIIVFDTSGAPHPLTSPGLPADSQVASLEVSRDGARVAILLSTSTGPRLVVAAIVRDDKQVPVSLGPPIIDVSFGGDTAVDATWADQLTIATLVVANGQSNVQLFTAGGQRLSLGTMPTVAASIVGGNNGQDGLRALGADSAIWTYLGSSWQSSKVKVDFIATQR